MSDEGIALVFEKATISRVKETYIELGRSGPDAETLAGKFPLRIREKYEVYLSED